MRTVAWVTILTLGTVSAWGQAPQKKRVAIFDFDNAAVQGGITLPFAEANIPNLGKAAADLLITKLGCPTVRTRVAAHATEVVTNDWYSGWLPT